MEQWWNKVAPPSHLYNSATNSSIHSEICTLNIAEQQPEAMFYDMKCIYRLFRRFVPGEKMLAFEVPSICAFLGPEPAFPLNMTYGNGVIDDGVAGRT